MVQSFHVRFSVLVAILWILSLTAVDPGHCQAQNQGNVSRHAEQWQQQQQKPPIAALAKNPQEHEHNDRAYEKSRRTQVILYCVIMGFALLMFSIALVCFVGCFCFPAGCCLFRKGKLHRAGRVYEKPDDDPVSKPKVFMVQVPIATRHSNGKTEIYVKTAGAAAAVPMPIQLAEPRCDPEKQLPYNPFFNHVNVDVEGVVAAAAGS